MRKTSGKKVIKSAVGECVGERLEEIAAVLRKAWETTHRHREQAGVNLEPRCQAGFSSAGSNYQIKSAHISLLLSERFHDLNLPKVVRGDSSGLSGSESRLDLRSKLMSALRRLGAPASK